MREILLVDKCLEVPTKVTPSTKSSRFRVLGEFLLEV